MVPDSPSLHLHPRDRQVQMTWRNGGGTTREVCAWPPGAALDAFEWRVSIAAIARSGPFSCFPGVMRTALLIDGGGVRLSVGRTCIELDRRLAQASFPGGEPCQCELVEEPVQLFNVMVRGTQAASVQAGTGLPIEVAPARLRFAYAARGAGEGRAGRDAFRLGEGDACTVGGRAAHWSLHVQPANARACMIVATIDPAGVA